MTDVTRQRPQRDGGPPPEGDIAAAEQSAAWLADTRLLDALDLAVMVTDLEGRILSWNTAAERLYGYSRAQMLGASILDLLVGGEARDAGEAIMSMVVSGQRWSGEFPVRCADGTDRRLRVTDSPLWRDGAVVGVIGIAMDPSDPAAVRADADVLAGRLDRLSRATAELAGARTVDDVNEVVVSHAAAAVDAVVAAVSLLDPTGEQLVLVGISGAGEESARRWATFPVSANVPSAEVLRTGRPLLLAGTEAIEARFPELAGQLAPDRSMVCLPLLVADRALGAVSLTFVGQHLPDSRELDFLTTLADACAQALERISAQREAAERAAKLEFLAQASEELSSSLDYRTTLANVARLSVPVLADWCAVQILEDGLLHTVGVAHVDPEKVALAEELQERYPTDMNAPTGASNVIRTGVSELYPEISEELLAAGAQDEEHLRISLALQLRSALIVPLAVHDRVLGAITLIAAESGRRYTSDDVTFAEDLARRAAVAIDNAQLHTETHEAAIRLQQAVLPSGLPDLPGIELAATYRPAGRTDVGGDLYDAIALPDGRLVLVVGDVMGRGVAAAAGMAQMRATIRAFISIDPDPAFVMAHLDRMFNGPDVEQLVTLLYVLVDGEEATYANAGHPPPLLLRPDAGAELLPMTDSLPLGAGRDDRPVSRLHLPAGAVLVAYTDGLIERRGEDITDGLDRLLLHGPRLSSGPLEEALGGLVKALHDEGRDDDVTVLALRRSASVS